MRFRVKIPAHRRWVGIVGLLLAGCAIENAIVSSRETAPVYRVFREVLLAGLVLVVGYWPSRLLLALITQERRASLVWFFWAFVALTALGILAFPLYGRRGPDANIAAIAALAGAWASATLHERSTGPGGRTS